MPPKTSKSTKKTAKKAQWKRRRVPRALASTERVFSEVYDGGQLLTNQGGIFTTSFNSIPQAASYAALFRQFQIRKLEVMLLPLYTDAEINTGLGTLDYQATRIAYSVSDTPMGTAPTSELDVLTDNGAKVVLGHKKITMKCWPKPYLTEVSPGVITNDYVAVRDAKKKWLNTTAFGNTNDGQGITHGGIPFYVSNNSANASVRCFQIYYKVQFAMRDPA